MGLTPDFRITLGEADLTARVRDRLLSITVADNSGEESDTLELRLDDRDNGIESPRRGAVLGVALGYAETGLYYLGRFTVDEVEPEGPPDVLTIRAKAADMRASLKAQRSRSFRDTTIGAIVGRIAGENGLEPAVAAALASRAVTHRDQANESDLHFLTRLGRDHGAVASIKDARLVFAAPSTGLSASGQAMPAVAVDRADLVRWRGLTADRDDQGSVRARWRDRSAGRTRFATAGDGDPVKTLRHLYASEAEAQAAAEAEFARTKRVKVGVELEMEGRAEIVAQTPVTVTGLREELTGEWIVETVEHRMDFGGSAFTSLVTGYRKAE